MDRECIKEAPTVAEAVDAALEQLGVQQDAVAYEILEEPGKKIFGLGSERAARVKVWIKDGYLDQVAEGGHSSDDAPTHAPSHGIGFGGRGTLVQQHSTVAGGDSMAKILVKVSTGEEYTISNAFYGASGPMTESEAQVQLQFLLKEMAYVTSDQGKAIAAQHIVTAEVTP
jgi:predicted RNA-binding protein Jag